MGMHFRLRAIRFRKENGEYQLAISLCISRTIELPVIASNENVQHDHPLSEHMAANTCLYVDNRFARCIRQQHFNIAVAVILISGRVGW